MRRRTTRIILIGTALALLACSPAGAIAASAQLPAELVRQHEAEITRTERALAAARTELSTYVTAQQQAAAHAAWITDRAELVRGVSALGPLGLPEPVETMINLAVRDAQEAEEGAEEQLDEQTEATAITQARALDAERRLKALRRASATEDERDTTLGAWRFGSGGDSVSAETLDRYLASKGSPLAGQGAAFLEAGVEQQLDPRLLVAIAGAESYFGIITCAPHNAWGWGCPNGPYKFETWSEAIHTVARGLRENYVDSGRTTVGEIHLKYAPPNAANDPTNLNYAWADNVARFLTEQGGDPQSIAGIVGPSR